MKSKQQGHSDCFFGWKQAKGYIYFLLDHLPHNETMLNIMQAQFYLLIIIKFSFSRLWFIYLKSHILQQICFLPGKGKKLWPVLFNCILCLTEISDQATKVEDLERILSEASARPVKISYTLIELITKNFSIEIGTGGSGVVYLVCC